MNWDDLRLFLAVGRSASLSEAGRRLGLDQSTVSRRLKALEARLDTRLIDRRTEGHVLTAAGTEMMETARNVDSEIAAIDRRLAGRNSLLTGRLRVTCTDAFLNRYLAPHVAGFALAHPEIDIDVTTSYQHLSLARREADIAIRTTARPPETLIGRRLFRFALGVYGAADHVRALPDRPDPASLTWLGWDSEAYNRILIHDHFPTAVVRHRSDSNLNLLEMARAGLGVLSIGCHCCDTDPAFARVYPEPITENRMDLWVLTHPDIRRTARVRAFMAFICDAFMADRDLFEGRRLPADTRA